MLAYSLILFPVGALFIVLGVLIYRGHTSLVHSYHQERVTDKPAYGRAMGKAVAGIGISALVSGAVSLFPLAPMDTRVSVAAIVFVAGFAGCFIWILVIQQKYNGGLF